MAANSNTIQLEIQIDDKGGVKVLRQIGTESEKAGKKGSSGFRSMSKSASAFNKQINLTHGLATKLGTAFGLWKMWHIAEGFLDVAVQTENYRLRLNALLGSVHEGNVLFDEMADFAARVPFSYDQIMASATQLAGVMSGGVSEIKQWIPLIADLAVVSGLDIQTATEQIIRMYSAGAASADLFRERGILAMLGFQAGVSYSAEETRKRLMTAWKDPESKFKDATDEMAKSWGGLVSMLGDKWFQFRSQVMEQGPFLVMKERLGDLLTEIDRLKKNGQLDIWAADMADGVLSAVDSMMWGFDKLGKAVIGFKAVFGILSEKYYTARLEGINAAIEKLEKRQSGFWSRFYAINTEEERKELQSLIDQLKEQRAQFEMNRIAGSEMAQANIVAYDEWGNKLDVAREKLAKLRADMQARRSESPETDTDLSVNKKTSIPGLSEKERKEIEKQEAKLWEYEVKGAQGVDDALLDAHEAMIEYEKDLYEEAAKNKISMTDKMYADLKFSSDDYYTYQLNQLMRQADDYETYTGNVELAHVWLTEQIKALDKERLEAAQSNNQYMIDLSQRTAEAMEQNFSDYYFDVMRGEFDDLGDYADAMLTSIQRATADVMGQMTKEALFGGGSSKGSGLISAIGSGIAGLFGGGSSGYNPADWAETLWAKGGAFYRGRVQAFAKGTVIDRPTIFPMASGAGLMGEDGPEGVLPLTRTPGGDLGVKTVGGTGGGDVNIEVNVINNGEPVEQSQPADIRFDGQKYIAEVHIDKMINSRAYRQANRQAIRGR